MANTPIPTDGRRIRPRKSRGFTLLEILAVVIIAGILMAGGYPKLTNFLWEVKLEQQARMVYQDLLLFIEATVAAGPSAGVGRRFGVATFENKHYPDCGEAEESGYRISRYSIIDPLDNLRASSMHQRDLAKEGFCLVPTNNAGRQRTSEVIEILVDEEGRIVAPLWPLYLHVKAFDSDTGETDDSVVWDIIIDPLDSRIRLQRANTGK